VSDDEDNAASDAQLAADKAALKAARNQLASAKAALAGATLTSPIDGVVAAVNLTVGQSVSGSGSGSGSSASGLGGSSSSSTSSAQIEVISTDSWIVDSTVDASSVDLIKVGNQAQLSITGYSGGTVYGTISSIAVLSSSSSGTASYPVVIAVTGSKSGLHDGQDVTATLIYKQLSNVIVVPTVALHRNSSGGEYVEKVVDGKPVQTTVQVGISSGTQTQITSGLTAGDKIQVQQFTVRRTGGTSGQPTGTTRGNFGGGNFPGGGNFGGGNFPGGGFGG
jgi:multidrug efflux pump subunit AcrA (membrane-fusion protein)